MCAHGWRVLAVVVVLLGDLLQLVLAIVVLVLFPLTWPPVLAQAVQCAERGLGLCAACLDVLQHRLLDVVAHPQQRAA